MFLGLVDINPLAGSLTFTHSKATLPTCILQGMLQTEWKFHSTPHIFWITPANVELLLSTKCHCFVFYFTKTDKHELHLTSIIHDE